MNQCVILYFRSILFQLWWCEMGVRGSLLGRSDSIGSKYLYAIIQRRHDVIMTSYRRWRKDASPNRDKPFIHASNSKYTTRDACSLQKSDVNFHLFLALRHASHITIESVKWRNYSRFNRQKKVYQQSWIFQTNSMTIRFHNKRPSTVAK